MPVPAAWACCPDESITVLTSTTAGMTLLATDCASTDWLDRPVDELSWGTDWIGLCAEDRGAKMLPVRLTLHPVTASNPITAAAAITVQLRTDVRPLAGLTSRPSSP